MEVWRFEGEDPAVQRLGFEMDREDVRLPVNRPPKAQPLHGWARPPSHLTIHESRLTTYRGDVAFCFVTGLITTSCVGAGCSTGSSTAGISGSSVSSWKSLRSAAA